jgi:hypothetical protein
LYIQGAAVDRGENVEGRKLEDISGKGDEEHIWE